MINYNEYINKVSIGSLETLGVYGALANKLIADLDAGDITEAEGIQFVATFQKKEGIDLVEYM